MRNAHFFTVPAFLLIATLVACSGPTETTPDLLGDTRVFLSPDTVNLLVVDVAPFADTEAFRKAEAELRAADGVGEVLEQLGMPLRDVAKRVVFAMADPGDDGRHADLVHVVVETSLDDGFLQRVMTSADHTFETEVVDGTTMWVQTEADAAVALAQYPGGYLGFGSVDAVRAMTRRAVAGSGGLAADAEPLQLARDMATGALAWGVVRANPAMMEELPQAVGDLSGLRHGILAVTHDAAGDTVVEVRVVTDSPQDAQDIEGRLQLIAGMGALSDDMDPDIADVLASLSVRRQGDAVNLRVVLSADFITALFGDGHLLSHD